MLQQTYDAKPCKHQIDDIINRLYHEHHFPSKTMTGAHDLPYMGYCVSSGKKRTVEPSPALGDEFG